MTPAVPKQVVDGGSTVYNITPDAGKTTYILPPPSGAACSGTLDTGVTPNTYTVTPVTADCGFTVAFSVEETSSVTGGNGTITPLGATGPLVPGSNSTVYALTPDAGYTPVVDGTCKGVFDGAANTYTVTDATADCTVIASFTNDPVTVTSSTSGGHGGIDTTGTINLPNGGSRTYTFTPDAGYYPMVTGNCPGTLVGNTYTVSPVTANCAFNVTFSSTTVDITATVTGGVGTLTPPGTTTVAQGGGQSYTATPGGGSVTVFEDSSTCPGVRSGNVYNVTGATANCSVNAKFVAAAAAVTVTTTVPGGHGTVTTPGQDGAGNTVLAIGDVRTWTVTPDTGYIPQVQSSTCAPAGTLSTTAPYTYTLTAAANCAVTFAFAPVAGAASIPTLSEWGLIILSILIGLFVLGMRRRRMI
ncbi:IPTL-CTERM sorting domain-containing protein [Comamonas flocculans]|uniref:IPTL-CTERM sorting domain-containing protein n=2 Tax=Comamonas flocculans TaxID=2597701 RepID=A0A5B8RYH0_9BURK|nr:IPTL-CTERM sorting domain-containing protein [Comamonas flocculans]